MRAADIAALDREYIQILEMLALNAESDNPTLIINLIPERKPDPLDESEGDFNDDEDDGALEPIMIRDNPEFLGAFRDVFCGYLEQRKRAIEVIFSQHSLTPSHTRDELF